MKKTAVFLDRDGTLIEEKGYLCRAREVKLLPGAAQAIHLLRKAGFSVILVTNQSAVARGLLTEAQLAVIHDRLQQLLHQEGTGLDAIYYCPHHPESGLGYYRKFCTCRKPEPGMLLRAARMHHLSLKDSFMVGDKLTDIAAGKSAGCRTILVRTGYGEQEIAWIGQKNIFPDFMVENLGEAARLICSRIKSSTGWSCSDKL